MSYGVEHLAVVADRAKLFEVSAAYLPHVGWILHESGDELVSLLRQGYFEAAEQAFLWRFLRPGDRVLDCGAHLGLYSLAAGKVSGGDVQVVCVEANARTADLLAENLKLSAASSARIVRGAIWNSATRLRFNCETQGRSAYARLDDSAWGGGSGNSAEVDAFTIDDVLGQAGFQTVELIKLDLEGAEAEALQGATRTLADGLCQVLMLEFTEANLERRGSSSLELARQVEQTGLRLCEFDADQAVLRPFTVSGPVWFQNLFAVRDLDFVNRRLAEASLANVMVACDILARAKACSRFAELEELPRLREFEAIAAANEVWALRAEAAMTETERRAADFRSWAEQAEAGKAEAERRAVDFRSWAEQAEAGKAEAERLAIENEAWARRIEGMLAAERAQGAQGSKGDSGKPEP